MQFLEIKMILGLFLENIHCMGGLLWGFTIWAEDCGLEKKKERNSVFTFFYNSQRIHYQIVDTIPDAEAVMITKDITFHLVKTWIRS